MIIFISCYGNKYNKFVDPLNADEMNPCKLGFYYDDVSKNCIECTDIDNGHQDALIKCTNQHDSRFLSDSPEKCQQEVPGDDSTRHYAHGGIIGISPSI